MHSSFLQSVEEQTRNHVFTTDCTIEEVQSMANVLQNSPQGSLLYSIGSAMVDAIGEH